MAVNLGSEGGQTFSWFVFGLMASVTFVGILSELLPSGVLPQMSADLGISGSQVGFLVGGYALASATFAIPLVSATLGVDRKQLLLLLLLGFAVSNIIVASASSYGIIVACRVLGGICAGVMWPMIAAYGTELVPRHMHGKAITVIMSGNTLGVSIGLPVMTTIGLRFGWRVEFLVFGLTVVAIALLSYFYLPSVKGEKLTRSNSPLAMLKKPSILIILLLTFLSVGAHYGAYTYITLIADLINFRGGIAIAMMIFGVGSIISVIISAKYIDAYLRSLVVTALVAGGISMVMLLVFQAGGSGAYLAFFLWGLAFGPLGAMYQTAISKQVAQAKSVATSVQSSVFNFSIMIATWIGGLLLTQFPEQTGARGIVYLSLTYFAAAVGIACFARRTLRSTPSSISSA